MGRAVDMCDTIDMITDMHVGTNDNKRLILKVREAKYLRSVHANDVTDRTEDYANISQYWYERLGVAHGNR